MRASVCGCTNRVTSQFTSDTASWLVVTTSVSANSASPHHGHSTWPWTSTSRRATSTSVSTPMLVAIAIAGVKVHPGVDAGRLGAQRLLDAAQRLDELWPVHRPEQAEAADAVAHRDLVGRLLARFELHQLLDRLPALGESLLDPL